MADTTEMIRHMPHAADRIAQEEPTVEFAFAEAPRRTASPPNQQAAVRDARSYGAASAYAQTVLRMVAACMAEEAVAVKVTGAEVSA